MANSRKKRAQNKKHYLQNKMKILLRRKGAYKADPSIEKAAARDASERVYRAI